MLTTSRYRVRDGRQTVYRMYTYSGGGAPSGQEYTPRGIEGTLETIADNNNRDFLRIKKSGGIVMSDCNMMRVTTDFRPGHITRTVPSTGWVGDQYGDFRTWLVGAASPPSVSALGLPSSDQLFITAFARMNQSELMSGETLGDLGKTLLMLKRPFRGATDLLTRMVKTRGRLAKKTVASVTKAAADTWLEYRYGWKPLILDADKIVKQCHVKRERCERFRLVSRAGQKGSQKWSSSWEPTALIQRAGSNSFSSDARRDVGVMYDVKNRTTTEDLQQFYGFRLRDAAPTLWELMPYSFVVDWFTNIGEWIQAINPDPSITVRSTWTTYTCTSIYVVDGRIAYVTSPEAVDNWQGSLGGETVTTFVYQRDALPAITLIPELTGKPLSALRQVDALSLLIKPIQGLLKGFRH